MQLGADGVFVGSGIFKSGDPQQRAKAIVEATTHYMDPEVLARVSAGLGEPMVGISTAAWIRRSCSRPAAGSPAALAALADGRRSRPPRGLSPLTARGCVRSARSYYVYCPHLARLPRTPSDEPEPQGGPSLLRPIGAEMIARWGHGRERKPVWNSSSFLDLQAGGLDGASKARASALILSRGERRGSGAAGEMTAWSLSFDVRPSSRRSRFALRRADRWLAAGIFAFNSVISWGDSRGRDAGLVGPQKNGELPRPPDLVMDTVPARSLDPARGDRVTRWHFKFPLIRLISATVGVFFVFDLLTQGHGNSLAVVALLLGLAYLVAGSISHKPSTFWLHLTAPGSSSECRSCSGAARRAPSTTPCIAFMSLVYVSGGLGRSARRGRCSERSASSSWPPTSSPKPSPSISRRPQREWRRVRLLLAACGTCPWRSGFSASGSACWGWPGGGRGLAGNRAGHDGDQARLVLVVVPRLYGRPDRPARRRRRAGISRFEDQGAGAQTGWTLLFLASSTASRTGSGCAAGGLPPGSSRSSRCSCGRRSFSSR